MYISDLDLLCENRNLKDIIMVSDTFGRIIKHIRNRIPVKSFNGSKKDFSMVALVRYLKGYIRIKDVREKIQSDFKTIDIWIIIIANKHKILLNYSNILFKSQCSKINYSILSVYVVCVTKVKIFNN